MKKLIAPILFMIICSCSKTARNACTTAPVSGCICTAQYDPVCGCDKKTYGNACEAKCAGVQTWTAGVCP